MLLAIDAGNTNIVFAVIKNRKVKGQWRISTNSARTADEYVAWLNQLMALDGLQMKDIKACIICTVVPQALFSLRQIARKYLNFEPLVVGAPGVELGVDVRIPQPEAVGADRLADAVGAHVTHSGDLILIDFGTATTLNIIAADGGYEGGIIAPGVNLSVEALHMAAAQLPKIAVERPPSVIGKGTVPAMQSGIFWGYISMIEGLVARVKAEYGKPMTVIATGGLSHLFRNATDIIDRVDDDLTINGLVEIYHRNAASKSRAAE